MSRSTIINVMKKYSFDSHLSVKDQKRIRQAKKRGLAAILRREKKDSVRVTVAVEFYYCLQRIFKTITLKQSILFMNASVTMALALVAFTAVLKTGVYQNFTGNIAPVMEAKAILINGDVAVKSADGISGKVELASNLSVGDSIITGPNSYIDIVTGTGKIARFGSDTKGIIKTLSESKGVEFFLDKGLIHSIDDRSPGSETGYIITTANCSVTAIGTSFSVSYISEKTVVAVSDGKVYVKQLTRPEGTVINGKMLEAGSGAEISDTISVRAVQEKEYIDLSNFKKQYSVINGSKILPVVSDNSKTNDEKITNLLKQKTRTISDIKNVFKRVDVVTLYTGEVIRGAILTNGSRYSIITSDGIRDISADDISSVEVVK
jgi:hypothetical protein